MNWPNDATRHYDGNDVKLVFYVHDPAQIIELIRRNGGKIDREATPIEALNGTVVGPRPRSRQLRHRVAGPITRIASAQSEDSS